MTCRVCSGCSTAYAVGIPNCPHCLCLVSYEEGEREMPKISKASGASVATEPVPEVAEVATEPVAEVAEVVEPEPVPEVVEPEVVEPEVVEPEVTKPSRRKAL